MLATMCVLVVLASVRLFLRFLISEIKDSHATYVFSGSAGVASPQLKSVAQ